MPSAFANDLTIESKCNGENLILTIIDEDGTKLQGVKVSTTDGVRASSPIINTFFSNMAGVVVIDLSKNTGNAVISKPGFNDQRIITENCNSKVPSWVKNNAEWWAEGKIDEDSFLKGMEFLIKEGIMEIPPNTTLNPPLSSSSTQKTPDWIKTTVEWWAHDVITDDAFLECMQFLVTNKIIILDDKQNTTLPDTQGNFLFKWSDGRYYDMPECTGEFPYRWSDDMCYPISEVTLDETDLGEYEFSVQDSTLSGYYDSENVESQTECPASHPYKWSDGNCWNIPEDYQVELECPSDYPYTWSDGNCYTVPECSDNYPYRHSNGQCYNVPECKGDYSYRWSDNQCYNVPECTASHPYRWDDGQCYNVPECKGDYSYRWSDNQCYNVPECKGDYPYRTSDGRCSSQPECPASHPYAGSDGNCYVCPESHPYKWSNGGCYGGPEPASCPDGSNGFYDSRGELFCCPVGSFGYPDRTCRT